MENYIELAEMKERIETRIDMYLYKVLKIFRKDTLKKASLGQDIIKKNQEKASTEVSSWEKQIDAYKNELSQLLSLELIQEYEKRELKELIAGNLWTISSALRTMNEELERYRETFYKMSPSEIYASVKATLKVADNYCQNVFPDINLHTIKRLEDFKLVLPEETLLGGVIGLGIRSEILHRLYPSAFQIMTRKSVWGMFFLAFENDEPSEFLKDEAGKGENSGKSRTTNNWEYDYIRFLFYSNFVANIIKQTFVENGISFSEKYRFGYVNMFLSKISDENKSFINEFVRWKYTGAN